MEVFGPDFGPLSQNDLTNTLIELIVCFVRMKTQPVTNPNVEKEERERRTEKKHSILHFQ